MIAQPERVSLVLPVAEEPRNETLALALVSSRRHVPWLSPVLVGSPLITEQYLDVGEGLIPFMGQHPKRPVENTTRMLAAALEDPDVTDPFVWSNDDVFFRAPVTLDYLRAEAAVARGRLREVPSRGRYGELAHATAALLGELGFPQWDYERHVPLVVNKLEMRKALGLLDVGKANPRSTYMNMQLEAPATVAADVKAFTPEHLDGITGPIFSTGNRFPIAELQRFLNFNVPESSASG